MGHLAAKWCDTTGEKIKSVNIGRTINVNNNENELISMWKNLEKILKYFSYLSAVYYTSAL